MSGHDDAGDLEAKLSDFDAAVRRAALEALARRAHARPRPGGNVNLHTHSFFSYNSDGHSPSRIAWEAAKAGLLAAGIVEFDVLDGLDEFLAAGDALGVRATVGLESRVFVKDYAHAEINSPGEPGISYHMGIGFHRLPPSGSPEARTLAKFRTLARRRNEEMAARVNAFLGAAAVDYERDVLPLAPSGNATERHMLAAYDARARKVFPDPGERAAYWSSKLGTEAARVRELFADTSAFHELVRAKIMKKGGPGYAPPAQGNFPTLEEMNGMTAACGALPCGTWLDGTSAGEADPRAVASFHRATGAHALNIIPDRNWNLKDPATAARKKQKLYEVVEAARAQDLLLIHGTERNKHGQPFVDDLGCEALAPLAEAFRQGALAAYGHTAMARFADRPLGGAWARGTFGDDRAARNRFYAEVGRLLDPGPAAAGRLRRACDAKDPGAVLAALARA